MNNEQPNCPVPNWPGVKLSGAKLSWFQIVWCQIVLQSADGVCNDAAWTMSSQRADWEIGCLFRATLSSVSRAAKSEQCCTNSIVGKKSFSSDAYSWQNSAPPRVAKLVLFQNWHTFYAFLRVEIGWKVLLCANKMTFCSSGPVPPFSLHFPPQRLQDSSHI